MTMLTHGVYETGCDTVLVTRRLFSVAWRVLAVALVAFAFSLNLGEPAWASSFTVSRIQLFLSPKAKSTILELKNTSTEPLRFQLNVFEWDQDANGAMRLAPTRDIVFFPQLLGLAPGEARNIRVGTPMPAAGVEKTYRLFIEELPALEGGEGRGSQGQILVRTKLGIPIFFRPPKELLGGRIEQTTLDRDGVLSFQIRNTGNVHFVVTSMQVTASGPAGEPVLDRALEGWYVLAGGTRHYELALPRSDCAKVRAISIQAHTSQTSFTARLEISPTACSQ